MCSRQDPVGALLQTTTFSSTNFWEPDATWTPDVQVPGYCALQGTAHASPWVPPAVESCSAPALVPQGTAADAAITVVVEQVNGEPNGPVTWADYGQFDVEFTSGLVTGNVGCSGCDGDRWLGNVDNGDRYTLRIVSDYADFGTWAPLNYSGFADGPYWYAFPRTFRADYWEQWMIHGEQGPALPDFGELYVKVAWSDGSGDVNGAEINVTGAGWQSAFDFAFYGGVLTPTSVVTSGTLTADGVGYFHNVCPGMATVSVSSPFGAPCRPSTTTVELGMTSLDIPIIAGEWSGIDFICDP